MYKYIKIYFKIYTNYIFYILYVRKHYGQEEKVVWLLQKNEAISTQPGDEDPQ